MGLELETNQYQEEAKYLNERWIGLQILSFTYGIMQEKNASEVWMSVWLIFVFLLIFQQTLLVNFL